MVDPEVMADMISYQLEDKIRFAPLARIDNTLVGRPGSTVTVPSFKYIGDAKDVAEGQAIDLELLETATEDFTIKKAGKGIEISDEAVLSGLGNPLGEGVNQLTMSIANKIDNDVLKALDGTSLMYYGASAFNLDAIANSIDIFNDEDDEPMVLLMNPKDASTLRKAVADSWERASDLGDQIIVRGTYGGVLGAQVVRSRKIVQGHAYLVKAGALAIYKKRGVLVEAERDIVRKTTVATADQHYGAHLYDESKAIKIILSGKTVAVTDVTVSPSTKTIGVGEQVQLSVAVLPANATDKSVTWSSASPTKVSVDENGLVTGVALDSTGVVVTAKSVLTEAVTGTATIKVEA